MVTRRQFLGSLARVAVAPAAFTGGLVSAKATAAPRAAPGEIAVLPDIWGQPGNYFETLEIGADRNRSPYERVLSDTLNEVEGNDWKKVSWPRDSRLGHRHLRIHWNKEYRSGSFAIPIFRGQIKGDDDPVEGRVVHCRYMVRVSENFPRAVLDSGKWLGFCSPGRPVEGARTPRWPNHPTGGQGVLLAGNGGGNVHGNDGWSARGGYSPRVKGGGDGAVPIYTYAYALDRELPDGRILLYHEIIKRFEEAKGFSPGARYTVRESLKPLLKRGEISDGASRTGRNLHWDHSGSPATLVPGRWHRVDQVMAINTPGVRDGWIRAYIDGRQVGNITKVRWRNSGPYRLTERYGTKTTLGIGAVWANFYQGGGSLYKRMTDEAQIDVYGIAVRVLEWDA